MELKLIRKYFGPNATIGSLYINDAADAEVFTLEDVVRDGPKIDGATAIPYGRYEVTVTFSERFQRALPLLLNVPGFEGIRIHPGNTDKDTHGCILVGLTKENEDFIGHSRQAFYALFPKILSAVHTEKIYITISSGAA